MSKFQKLKNTAKSVLNNEGIFYRGIRKIYHYLSTKKYEINHAKETKINNKKYLVKIQEAIQIIKKYNGENYIALYNPTWLGVAASTKGLFKNSVPLEQVFSKKDAKKIAKVINDNNIKSVIFSQIVDGWTEIIKELHNINSNIKSKVIWHGNCYEFFSDYTWNLNKEVMNLYNEGKIDSFAFVRTTMYEFYKKVGFKSYYLQNNVHKNNVNINQEQNKEIKIGVYNADSRELKNIYTSLSAIKLVKNAIADVVPINEGARKFSEILNLNVTSVNDYIPNEELMARIKQNSVNIYPTFTENAPMFPLESFEMGVPCLLGNNNDFFNDTPLEKFVVLKKEDDAEYIKDKIEEVIKHKEEVMKLYKQWKKEFDKKCDELVEKFVRG